MTYEEAMQSVLTYCIEECGKMDAYKCENKECVEAVVIKALKKQIPKKPRETRCALMCPSCGHKITEKCCKKLNRFYCKKCGQAIDWEVSE